MGLFGQSSPFDADVEKATSETNTNENWSLILDVCDKVSSNPRSAKDCLKAIMKRMGHNDPHVVMQAITLLDACANNCGKPFHLEIASRDFENEFRRLLTKAIPKVSIKMRQVLKNWAENDFKNDPELNLIPSLYMKLRQEEYDFSNLNEKPPKSASRIAALKDPNVVSSQQEEDDIAKAIELSLKETKGSPKHQSNSGVGGGSASGASAYPSLYPSFAGSGSIGSITSTGGASNNSTSPQPEPRKVRALYDFEAAEENELTFFAGEIIHVLDDSDPNWWKGFNQRGDGLFPSNFVSADLSVDPERLDINQQNKSKKSVQFEDDSRELQQKTEAAVAAVATQTIEVDESKVDRLLHLLHEANPEDPSQDSEEMLRLEQEVHQMGPLIDAELERVDRKHAQLTQLSSDLVDAINLYHSLMREDRNPMVGMPDPAMYGMMGGMRDIRTGMGSMMYNPPAGFGMRNGFPNAGSNFPTSLPQMDPSYSLPSMPSMPNPGQPPVTTQQQHPSMVAGPLAYGPQPHLPGGVSPAQPQIPIHYQNGHGAPPQMNALPQHMNSPMAPGQQAQHMYSLPGQQPPTQSASQQPTQPNIEGYNMLYQQQQQHQHQQQHQIPQEQQSQMNAVTTANSNTVNGSGVPSTMPNHPAQQLQTTASTHQAIASIPANPQFISPQHQQAMPPYNMQQQPQQQQQQQQPTQYATMPNGPQAYMSPSSIPPPSAGHMNVGAMMPPTGTPLSHASNNNNNADQFMQLQQQMAAMSMGMSNQPVTQSFLVQNKSDNNVPIYQQQR